MSDQDPVLPQPEESPSKRLARVFEEMAREPALLKRETPRTHQLFLVICAMVSRAPEPGMTVAEIAEKVGLDPAVVSACIGLHVHLEHQGTGSVELPLPRGYWAPTADEVITEVHLALPKDSRAKN